MFVCASAEYYHAGVPPCIMDEHPTQISTNKADAKKKKKKCGQAGICRSDSRRVWRLLTDSPRSERCAGTRIWAGRCRCCSSSRWTSLRPPRLQTSSSSEAAERHTREALPTWEILRRRHNLLGFCALSQIFFQGCFSLILAVDYFWPFLSLIRLWSIIIFQHVQPAQNLVCGLALFWCSMEIGLILAKKNNKIVLYRILFKVVNISTKKQNTTFCSSASGRISDGGSHSDTAGGDTTAILCLSNITWWSLFEHCRLQNDSRPSVLLISRQPWLYHDAAFRWLHFNIANV